MHYSSGSLHGAREGAAPMALDMDESHFTDPFGGVQDDAFFDIHGIQETSIRWRIRATF